MPNWVFNNLDISGNEVDIAKIKAQLNQPFSTYYNKSQMVDGELVFEKKETKYSNPVFAFWNIIHPDESDFDEYFAVESKTRPTTSLDDPNWLKDILDDEAVTKHWYGWNNHHWGTKWDVANADGEKWSNTELVSESPTLLQYSFETAWSPVIDLLVSFSEDYPNLTFSYRYEEEQGWGGSVEFQNGEILDVEEWDIPSSHADYVAQDKECNCAHEEDSNWWFEDCPVDTTKYEFVDGYWFEKEAEEEQTV